MTNSIYVLISYYPKYLISIILYSLVNLDKLEKSRKKNTKKDSDSLMDNDSSSKISKSNKKENTKTREESLMDHLKKIENGDAVATVETDLDTEDQSVYQKQNVDDNITISNDALISEADRLAKESLLNSSDSTGKQFGINKNTIIMHTTSFKCGTFKIYDNFLSIILIIFLRHLTRLKMIEHFFYYNFSTFKIW